MPNKLLNFRCPDELLAAIDNLGKQRYPADNDNGCDRSKTLLDIIEAGVQALGEGTIKIERKTVNKNSKTDIENTVRQLQEQMEVMNSRLKKLSP